MQIESHLATALCVLRLEDFVPSEATVSFTGCKWYRTSECISIVNECFGLAAYISSDFCGSYIHMHTFMYYNRYNLLMTIIS